MFKLSGFDLASQVKHEQQTNKKNKKRGTVKEAMTADSLQDLLHQLGRDGDTKQPGTCSEGSLKRRHSVSERDSLDRQSKPTKEAPKGIDKSAKEPSAGKPLVKRSKIQQKQKQAGEPKEATENVKRNDNNASGKLTDKRDVKKDSRHESKVGASNKDLRAEKVADRQKSKKDQKVTKSAVEQSEGLKPKKPPVKLSPMQLKMQQKLSGARFRWINEKLYTSHSKDAVELFKTTPEAFKEYHQGFRHQVESWPENPVDSLIQNFKDRLQKPINAPGGLPGKPDGEIVVADMGCGEAELSRMLAKVKGGPKSRKAKFTIHSFDLHKANDRITVADIANVPLPDKSVDVVVFCLALMGTNLEDFVKEGIRILRPHGEMWIAEIKSRFDLRDGKTDVTRFVETLKRLGLHYKLTDDSNKMFVRFEFVALPKKEKTKFIDDPESLAPLLKPCIYKKR